jgi:hypothetical protein
MPTILYLAGTYLLNETVVNNHILSATTIKLRKYNDCHKNASENGRPSSSIVTPFAVDTLGDFCSVAIIFLKKLAKTKFAKIPGSKEFQDLTASTWVNTTSRDAQTAIIKTCANNNRSALKLTFGEEYDKLYPGSIYSPPSYNAFFSSSEEVKIIDVPLSILSSRGCILILTVRSILGTPILCSIGR